MHHSAGDQPDRDRGDKVDDYREAERRQHHDQVFAPKPVKPDEHAPADDVPADLDQHSGQCGKRIAGIAFHRRGRGEVTTKAHFG